MKDKIKIKYVGGKYRRKRITTWILTLTLVGGFFAGVGVGFGYVDPGLSRPINCDKFYSTWMSTIKDETKLVDVVIPGSHDAGSNKMMPQAMTQGHDIKDQLKGGVRYFDTRVTDKGNDLAIFHGPIKGQKFSKVMREFKDFLHENPSEFVIIDFQHLGDKVHQKTINMIKDYLPIENMLDSSKFEDISKVTFKTIRENKLNYMIVWKDEVEAKENNFYTRENSLRSEYDGPTHKKSDEALIKKYDEYYANHEENKLFVLQTQRTAKTLLGKPSFYEKRISNKIDQYVLNIANDNSLLSKTNIIMRDFVVSNIKKVNNILSLNLAKNNVQTESLVLFRNRVQK